MTETSRPEVHQLTEIADPTLAADGWLRRLEHDYGPSAQGARLH
jgi:hypothetical protein